MRPEIPGPERVLPELRSLEPDPMLVRWLESHPVRGFARAAVIGHRWGVHVPYLASLGLPAQEFMLGSRLRRETGGPHLVPVDADGARLPAADGPFDLVVVFELIRPMMWGISARGVMESIVDLAVPGGTVLVIAAAAVQSDGRPWPLTGDELREFGSGDLELVERTEPDWRSMTIEYRRSTFPR
ncbi:hypothetical protein KIH74_12395 [Kineosporia sp. J2-2]|uniref:Methyltransferase domain-containing protein n=1 Tax=Kineosporia corallincola TaxID=2835133 RepID=A0ABS5TF60_9ACTN|nr:class I SAM-dependent methyltransferase [Kineosporia corallincola]MBT0769729.1 hypothetical protein [Kineosporia corallincola]